MERKSQLNLRVSALTERQLTELAERWGTSKTETISIVVDRVYQQERGTAMTTMTQTTDYTGWEITTGFLSGNLLGSETDGVDVDASVRLYQQRLQEAISEAFPGATVRVDYQDAEGVLPASLQTRIYPPQPTYQDDLRDQVNLVENIRNEVWDNTEGWVVYA